MDWWTPPEPPFRLQTRMRQTVVMMAMKEHPMLMLIRVAIRGIWESSPDTPQLDSGESGL